MPDVNKLSIKERLVYKRLDKAVELEKEAHAAKKAGNDDLYNSKYKEAWDMFDQAAIADNGIDPATRGMEVGKAN